MTPDPRCSLARIVAPAPIPGIGLLIATVIVALVGDIHLFPDARHFARYLGLSPREFSSTQKRRLGRISKRGDVYQIERWLKRSNRPAESREQAWP